MMRSGLLAMIMGFAAFAATAALAADKPAPPNIDQAVAFPGGIVADRDLVYATIEGFRPLTLDVYQSPPKPKELPRPAIIFVHGGGWATGDARHATGFDNFPAILAALAAKAAVAANAANPIIMARRPLRIIAGNPLLRLEIVMRSGALQRRGNRAHPWRVSR